jgi:transposase InsO family protein
VGCCASITETHREATDEFWNRMGEQGANLLGILRGAGIEPLKLSPRSPNLNAYAEHLVRSVRLECLDRLILLGRAPLERTLDKYLAHYNAEHPHQGLYNRLLTPPDHPPPRFGRLRCRARFGGLLRFYCRDAS